MRSSTIRYTWKAYRREADLQNFNSAIKTHIGFNEDQYKMPAILKYRLTVYTYIINL